MEYEIGKEFMFRRFSKFDKDELVKVESLRKHGSAKLSNGWVVDDSGRAEGTNRTPGGWVEEI